MKIKLSILFLCLAMSIFSQEKVDISFINTPLLEVLKETETNYGVKFSFNNEIIKEQTFSFSKKDCELISLLTEIEHQIPLFFHKISNRYYYITQNSSFKQSEYNLLNEVKVVNYVTSGVNKKKDGSISILPKHLGVLPGLTEPDVFESLKIIPGVQTPNETATDMYIRGGTPNQNLVLWDGIKIYNYGHFFGMISVFNPHTTKEIILSKGGTQARYGNRISGVIDIKTNEEIPNRITGSFGLNMTHADALVSLPLSKKMVVSVSARSSFSDLAKTFTYDKLSTRVFQFFNNNQENQVIDKEATYLRKNDFNFSDYTTKLIYTPTQNQSLSLSFLHTKNKLYNNFTIPLYKDSYKNGLLIKNTGISANWKVNNSKASHTFTSYFSYSLLKYIGGYNFIQKSHLLNFTKKNTLNDFGFSYNTNLFINKHSNLFFGYDFMFTKTQYSLHHLLDFENVNILDTEKKDVQKNNTHALFGEYIYNDKHWNLNIGTRFNYFSIVDKFVVEPRLYLERKLKNGLSFKTSFETKHQTLSQIVELQSLNLGFDLENQVWVQANNEDIQLQKSMQVSAGLLFNKNNWKIDIEPYLKRVNGITSHTSGYNDQTIDFSNGKGKVFGIDVLINKRFNNYRTWVNYTYTKNKIKFSDLENKYFPANHDITNYFSWSHAYTLNNYEFSLGWIYRTGTPYTGLKNFYVTENGYPFIELDFVNTNALRLPNYSRMDFSMNYSFNFSKRWKGKLGFSVRNIFNKKNILNRVYNAVPIKKPDNEIEYQLKQIDKVSLGIMPNISFRVRF